VKEDSSFNLSAPGNAVMTPTISVLLEFGTTSTSDNIEREMRRLRLDTGSNIWKLQPGVSRSKVKITNTKPYGSTGETLDVKGRPSVSFELDGHEFRHMFLVCSLPAVMAVLLGTDFMEGTGAS
jgi:hypothetical protein